MAMEASLREQLEVKRDRFEDECTWMRFLIDSYTGGGGYMGRVKQPPSGFWGRAAEVYTSFRTSLLGANKSEQDSYLDRHSREETPKYQKRVNVAHYPNYMKPIANLYVSYLLRKPLTRQNVPPEIEKWIQDTGHDRGRRLRALRAVVAGWFPVVVDKPLGLAGARNAGESGNVTPYCVELLPCNLVDYGEDADGNIEWAKMCVKFKRKPAWNAPAVAVDRYTLWTATEFVVFEVLDSAETKEIARGTHSFLKAPIVIVRASVSIEDKVKSDSLIGDAAVEARRLFNYVSELDEHLRGQVFAVLVLAMRNAAAGGEINLGTDNGLLLDTESKNVHYYLAPPGSVAETLERRIEKAIIEIYRISRVEYDRASGVASSAQSRQQNFEQTNLVIADLAQSMAVAERETLILVGRGMGIDEAKLQKIAVIAPENFDTEQLNDEIDQIISILTITGLGRTFRVELLQRFAQTVLPHLSADIREAIMQDIEDEADKAEQEAAAAAADAKDEATTDDGPGEGEGLDTQGDGPPASTPKAGAAA